MARTLVTGGAGFIGSHVCEALLARGDEVTIVDSFDPFYNESIKRANLAEVVRVGDCRLVEADIRDRDRMTSLFTESGFDVVVHLAAKA
ncbi:MAG: GDP-mannose 4,6-dehydratase, partial [Planctomycetes bacterium]|nr:GDP-mannose 4,6-dehydratase [Planctomycetota bacterium]